MKRAPNMGERVYYPGNSVIGPCSGTVVRVYPEHAFRDDRSDEWNALHGKLLPESRWHVAVKLDALPERWCYTGIDTFAPSVADIELIAIRAEARAE